MLRNHDVYAGAECVGITREDALDGQENGVDGEFVACVLLGWGSGSKLEK